MSEPKRARKPEVMSPAGYWPQLRAAIEAGADSVYFGLHHFSARAKTGFSLAELPEALRELHLRGVKGFVTFNTLVFDSELDEAARTLAAIAEAGADAIIVQDLGAVKLAREIAPGLDVHGSTQMSITSTEGVELAQSLGVCRVVLARELSLEEIRAIRTRTECELEMFVHGALCVSYSGQCFSSEAWGGRSANRGQCAQACRLPYEMIVDGQVRPLGDARYLLSPGDLYTLREIPEIVASGVSSLKIEGRYKDAGYVALTTRAYRKAVDDAWAGLAPSVSAAEELQLEQVYSRGSGPYFVSGTNHQAVVEGRAPRHRGVRMGSVVRVEGDAVIVEPSVADRTSPLKPGDGLVFDAADWRSPQEREEGGRAYEAKRLRNGSIELRFANGSVDFARIRPGDLVWRTHDPDLEKAVRPYLEPSAPVRKQPVRVRVTACEGAPMIAEWFLEANPDVSATVISESSLAAGQNRMVDETQVCEQFGRLGNTPYELAGIELETQGRAFAPSSLLNQMRREAVEKLQELQGQPRGIRLRKPAPALRPARRDAPGLPQLHLLVRTPEQLEAALACRPASVTLDYLDLYGLRPSVERLAASGIEARVASPRVLKLGEERIADFLASLGCRILVRPAGLLHALHGKDHPPLDGDFSLNAANAISAQLFMDLGLSRLTPTHDLNSAQVCEFAQSVGAGNVEAVVYHHLPVFHTEHCVFCRFLSSGTSYKDCGRPCEKHQVALRDENGRAHPVMADVGCRNTVFGAEAQEASLHIDEWRRAGIRHFRAEFAHENAAAVRKIGAALLSYLSDKQTSAGLRQELQKAAPEGVTEGSLFVPKNLVSLAAIR